MLRRELKEDNWNCDLSLQISTSYTKCVLLPREGRLGRSENSPTFIKTLDTVSRSIVSNTLMVLSINPEKLSFDEN